MNCETWIMTLRSSDLQSGSDLDSIRNPCDVYVHNTYTTRSNLVWERRFILFCYLSISATMSKWSFPLPQGKRQSQGSPNCWKGMHSGHFDLNRDTCLSFPCQASSLWGPLEYWSLKVDWSKPTGQLSILFQLEDLFSNDGGAVANWTVADQIDLFIRLQTFPQILPHFRFQCVH